MQVVIDIPEKAYNLLKGDGVDWLGAEHILSCVAEGKILPKGHGDLIDRDQLENEFGAEDMDIYAKDIIREMPVIVPKEGVTE